MAKQSSEKIFKIYEKAKEAFQKHNYDYAINLLMTAIGLSPQFTKARHLMHLIARKKLESNKSIILSRITGNIVNIPNYFTGLFYLLKTDYSKALISFEKILIHDPVNIQILKIAGTCAKSLKLIDSSIEFYETVKILIPSDIKNLKQLGDLYKDEVADLEKAKECYANILQYDKNNYAARKGISDVAALGTIEKGSYDDISSSFLTKVKNIDYTDIVEKKMRAVKSEEDLIVLINDTLQNHQKEPHNVKIVIELAKYHLQAKNYEDAVSWFEKARSLNPDDYTLTKHIMNTRQQQIDDKIIQLMANNGDKKQIAELEKLKIQTVLQYLKEMVDEKPTDRELRYQFGKALFNTSSIDEAIKQFQIAINEPRYRLKAYNYLGLCFSRKNMFDLAEVQFNTALENYNKTGQINEFTKEVLYNLASAYENMGQIEHAIETFKNIYKIDIGYKDVSQKIDKSYYTN